MNEGKRSVRTTIVLPVEVHTALRIAAAKDQRSLHREILVALEQFVRDRGTLEESESEQP